MGEGEAALKLSTGTLAKLADGAAVAQVRRKIQYLYLCSYLRLEEQQ